MKDQAAPLQPLKEIASLKPFTDEFSQRSKEIYDSIALRALEIFESSGRVSGRDHENWLKAEAELLHPVHRLCGIGRGGYGSPKSLVSARRTLK